MASSVAQVQPKPEPQARNRLENLVFETERHRLARLVCPSRRAAHVARDGLGEANGTSRAPEPVDEADIANGVFAIYRALRRDDDGSARRRQHAPWLRNACTMASTGPTATSRPSCIRAALLHIDLIICVGMAGEHNDAAAADELVHAPGSPSR